ncbi:MAG: D-alanyl-D-alanine carboxypeptidase/D-alanyl-D-alanine-endopeptidase [Acidobacteria bacterium RIFCSPLOWO2_02_FULL_67_36]|nr:MAG: D-alanyl-D-alanine carboxypeptidase/D-alanyl-D-alanine-endopeptidase [Acidobacteria bacterium RIFCSPLOWO2_02_FULL_67_36]OFW19061.1 MAG: D-alanyl-D-alanine carboxypeptidase/D-alanyl-D-alanine-endopeptidase [Acidobacteria bacterium RIFCSPLOWO2_12_FULL_66_21]
MLKRYVVAAAMLASAACTAEHRPVASRPGLSGPARSPAVRHLRSDLDAVFGAPIMARGVWGVDVRSLDTGETLYQLNAGKLMMPASNMKIVTLASTAEALGWDYRYTTTLETGAEVSDGILHGDLLVRGNGDPSINARQGRAAAVLDEWAAALKAAGIAAIDGRVVGDDQAFDDEGIGAGWAWDYLEAGYAAPGGALEFNEDTASLTIAAGAAAGAAALVTVTPGAGYTIVNHAVTAEAGTGQTIDVRRRPDAAILEIAGSIPAGSSPVTRSIAVINPTVFFAQSLRDGLVARGVAVSGSAVDFDDIAVELAGAVPVERRVLASTQSPPLKDIATVLMKVSQNLYAETLLKTLGASKGGLGTTRGGIAAARASLSAWGVPQDALVMVDGSGLSRYNYLTAGTITTVLERMYKDPRHRDAFLATLPIAGKDGTIASRLKRTRAEGNALAKTGSIANVRALSGFLRTRDGEMLVFSILTNDFVIPVPTVNYIADLGVEILSNFTRG